MYIRKNIFLLICLITVTTAKAQNISWLTNTKDTSYSTGSAYRQTQKLFKNIQIVEEKPSDLVKEFRNVTYCNLNGRVLKTDVFLPETSKNKTPAILIIHGGGWRSGSKEQHIPLAQVLAKAGYACFTAEYRLSTEAFYPAAVNDLKAATKWMRANADHYNIDTTKFVVLGFSAGGELATFLGFTGNMSEFEGGDCQNDLSSGFQAIIDIDGTLAFIHPESTEGDDSRSISAATHWFGISKIENPELWVKASPLTYAQKNKAPVLFLNSSKESMHAGRTDFIEIMNKKKIYTEVHTFENSPHSFCLFDPWFTPTVNYITSFLTTVLGK